MQSRPKGRKVGRVVRHTMVEGTVKEYCYAPHQPKRRGTTAGDTLASLIAPFQRSPEWLRLAAGTRQNYILYLRTLDQVGHVRAPEVKRRDILAIRDSLAASRGNGAAFGFVQAVSALFARGVDREWREHHIAHGCTKGLPRGHLRAWTSQEAETAISLLPEHLRRFVVLALYTGRRRGDLCSLPLSAYDGRAIRLTQGKTSEPLVIPCHPALKAELDSWAACRTAVTMLTDVQGKPWKPNLLSHYLPAALVRFGLSNELNIHEPRKLAATNLAEAGCSAHEIASVTGQSAHCTFVRTKMQTLKQSMKTGG